MSACPECGTPAEPGQLVCVNCGARLALRQPPRSMGPPGSALPVVAILLAVVVIGAVAFGFALSEITSDDDDRPEQTAGPTDQPAPAANRGEPQESRQADTEATATEPAETVPGTSQEQRRSTLLEWPERVSAHTVVLVTTGDRPAARRVAEEAASAGLEAGLLRSDDYDLGTGLWIVYAGRFDNRDSAVRQAANLAERYPGAYAQFVSAQ